MDHKLVTLEDFKVVGMEYVGKNEKGEIGVMWGAFNERDQEIDTPYNNASYGICYDMNYEGGFSYLAGMKVDTIEHLPHGMKVKAVPGGKFAIFTFKEHISKIGEFWGQIYGQFLPGLGLEPEDRVSFEYYDERFMKNGECDIYIPVK